MPLAPTLSASNAPNEEVELTGDYITDGASYFRTQATNLKSWDELVEAPSQDYRKTTNDSEPQ